MSSFPFRSTGAMQPAGGVGQVALQPGLAMASAGTGAANVSVNVAGPRIMYETESSPGFVVRVLWFLFIGWYLGFFWILLAWLLNATIIGLPLGLAMFNVVPKVMTLKSRQRQMALIANANGTYTLVRRTLQQRSFTVRAVFFICIGWWFSLVWAMSAYAIGLPIVTLPISFWMFDRIPAVTTLGRY